MMDSDTEQLVYCELCEYLSLDDVCDHLRIEASQQTENDAYEKEDSMVLSKDTLEELLISLMEPRRQLWETKLPITKRDKVIKDRLWIEIYEALQRQHTIEFLIKKWRNLRDAYIKKKAEIEEYRPSGSAAKINSDKKIWKHYNILKFLSDTVAPRMTSSNLEPTENTAPRENNVLSVPSTSKMRRTTSVSNSNKVEGAFIDAIQNIQPPKLYPDSEYKVNPICLKISKVLDDLEDVKRARLELDLLTQTYMVAYPSIRFAILR